ncbi:MAG: hypothetical protein ACP5PX_07950 [Candidatus Hadarchaeum sp.]|uniref:hypothetical protein n=1 Tax=Candidatus Hadarchaeum sp. TaxID=2883567 RepID=UPI003D10753B
MENKKVEYTRGDLLYMAGATIAAIGETLGHKWTQLTREEWEQNFMAPEAIVARLEWLKEAQGFAKDSWRGFDKFFEETRNSLPEFREFSPFYLSLKHKSPQEIYDLVNVIAHRSPDVMYVDLVMGVDPLIQRVTQAWEETMQERWGLKKLDPPPPLSEEAAEAIKNGALPFLVKHTYYPEEILGINSPDVKVKYREFTPPHPPSLAYPDNTERNIEYIYYEHITGTGRGHFMVSYGYGQLDFHFRVERGGEYQGLTAMEAHLRLTDEGKSHLVHQITPLAEERHYEYAVDLLAEIGRNLEKHTRDHTVAYYEVMPMVEKVQSLVEAVKEEYQAKFGLSLEARKLGEGEYEAGV